MGKEGRRGRRAGEVFEGGRVAGDEGIWAADELGWEHVVDFWERLGMWMWMPMGWLM